MKSFCIYCRQNVATDMITGDRYCRECRNLTEKLPRPPSKQHNIAGMCTMCQQIVPMIPKKEMRENLEKLFDIKQFRQRKRIICLGFVIFFAVVFIGWYILLLYLLLLPQWYSLHTGKTKHAGKMTSLFDNANTHLCSNCYTQYRLDAPSS